MENEVTRPIRFIPSRFESQRSVTLNDGRIIALFNENNEFYLRFDTLIDLEKGIFYQDRLINSIEEIPHGLTCLNKLIYVDKVAEETYCHECIDYDDDVYPLDVYDHKKKYVNKIHKFFKEQGYDVDKEDIKHNIDAWCKDYKSGYRNSDKGYHLFSPCGCNPLSIRLTTLHQLCDDWQITYEC